MMPIAILRVIQVDSESIALFRGENASSQDASFETHFHYVSVLNESRIRIWARFYIEEVMIRQLSLNGIWERWSNWP
jgi:hypothetical protein